MSMPRQVINSGDMNEELFQTSLSLVGHEISAVCDEKDGLFGENTIAKVEDLPSRVQLFANIGRKGK